MGSDGAGAGRFWGVVERHELRTMFRDRGLSAGLFCLLLLCWYGVFNGWKWARFQERMIASARAEESGRLSVLLERARAAEASSSGGLSDGGEGDLEDLGFGLLDSHVSGGPSAASAGVGEGARHAILRPGPLAALAVGQSDLSPYYATVTTGSFWTVWTGEELANPSHLATGRLDLAFVLVALYPLAILALTYNAISGERESGTLGMLLAQPLSSGRLARGKVAARGALALGIVVSGSAPGLPWAWSEWGWTGVERWLAWTSIGACYGAFWFAAGLAVTSLGRSSSTNAVVLALTWLGLTLIVPALLNLTAGLAYPTPSRVEWVVETREAALEANAMGSRALARYFEDHPELSGLDGDEFAARALGVRSEIERRVEPLARRFEEGAARQREWINLGRFATPAALAFEGLQDAAGRGWRRQEAFREQTRAFHAEWRAFFDPRVLEGATLSSEEIAGLPEFEFREEDSGAFRVRTLVTLAGLLIPTAALGWFAAVRLRRYPVSG